MLNGVTNITKPNLIIVRLAICLLFAFTHEMAMDYSSAHNDWRENSYAPGTSPEDFKPNMTDIEIGKVVHDIVHEPVDMDTGRVENALLAKHTTEPTSLEDPNAQPGVCGLRNLGNTCYMNAGIQALLSVPQLTEHFTDALLSDLDEWPRGTEEPESRGLDRILEQVDTLLYNAYTKLIRSVWSGRYTYLTPTAFKAFIGEAFHPFRGYKAHDCQEFMGVFLDHINAVLRADRLRHSSLREESDSEPSTKSPKLEKNSVCASAYGSDTPTVVESAFRGKFSTKVTCCECRHETVLEEPFFFLSVPLPRGFERQVRRHLFIVSAVFLLYKVHPLISMETFLSARKSKNYLIDFIHNYQFMRVYANSN